MKVLCPNGKLVFEVDDEIASSISAVQSTGNRSHYSCGSYEFLLNLNDIETAVRGNGKLWFRGVEDVNEIVQGFKNGIQLPAIEVTTRELAGYKEYRVKDGFHRYWLSHIAGFTKIPVKINDFLMTDLE